MPNVGSIGTLNLKEINDWLAQRQANGRSQARTVNLTNNLSMGLPDGKLPLSNAFLKAHAYYALLEGTDCEDFAFNFLTQAYDGNVGSREYKQLKQQSKQYLEAVV